MNPQYIGALDRIKQNLPDRRLVTTRSLIMAFLVFFLFTFGSAHAKLINNGNNLIYDTDLNITWYNPNVGAIDWDDAMDWVANLAIGPAVDWRLPSVIGNELGLLYAQLRNTDNINYFTNLQAVNYWTSTLTAANYLGRPHAYAFSFTYGGLGHAERNLINGYSAIAIHPGNVSAAQIPEPGVLLLIGSSLAGLAMFRRKLADRTFYL